MRMATDPDPPDDRAAQRPRFLCLPGNLLPTSASSHFQSDEKGRRSARLRAARYAGPQIGVRVVGAMENGARNGCLKARASALSTQNWWSAMA